MQIDLFVRPGGAVFGEHVHPQQSERFVVKSGEEITVPPQTPHVWWNQGEEELNVLLEFRPAGDFAEFVTTMFAWAQSIMHG